MHQHIFRKWYALGFIALLLILPHSRSAYGQEIWPPPPETLFAPGIEVVDIEVNHFQPPPTVQATPQPTVAPRCGFMPYQHFGETDDWLIDYESEPIYTDSSFHTPIILCNRTTDERRELLFDEPIIGVSISPNQRHAVFIARWQYFSYDFEQDQILLLSETSSQYYDQRVVDWHGDNLVLINEWMQPDGFVWQNVSIADVTQANSFHHVASVLKYEDVPWFRNYQTPKHTAWVGSSDSGCTLEWLHETGARESFDISGICEVGIQLTDDFYGDYLFTPIQYRTVQEEPQRLVEAYSRDLVRLNLTTGERTVWYSGEVERLNDLDPSQRYATLVLDNNGCIDIIFDDLRSQNDLCGFSNPPSAFEVALLDTTTGEIIYRRAVEDNMGGETRRVFNIDTGFVDFPFFMFSDRDAWVGGDLFSIGGNQFVLFRLELVDANEPEGRLRIANDILVTLNSDNTITETALPGQLLLAGLENQLLVLFNTDRDLPETGAVEADLLLYNSQGQSMPFISNVENAYDLQWGSEQRYDLWITRGESPDILRILLQTYDLRESVIYTVRVR